MSTNMRSITNKEVRDIVDIAVEQGWSWEIRGNHMRLLSPHGGEGDEYIYTMASTPSDYRAIENARSALRQRGVVFPGDKGWEKVKKANKVSRTKPIKLPQQQLELLGQRLVRQRQEAGLSQTELAEQVGVTQATISTLERGKKKPHSSTIRKVAPFLGFESVDDLLLDLAREQATAENGGSEPAEALNEPDASSPEPSGTAATPKPKTEDELIEEALAILENLDSHLEGWAQITAVIDGARELVVDGQTLGIVLSTREADVIRGVAKKFGR